MSSTDVASRLQQRVWNASIPLEIRLHKEDCRTYEDSDPYLIQFPRISYLGLALQKLHNFFYSSLIYPHVSPSEAWLEYDGVPLKWHYPLGLLYDLYSGAEPAYPSHASGEQHTPLEEAEEPLPWKLTVHFSNYPDNQLIKLDTEDKHLHDLFMNNVKQADYLRTGTGKTVMFLSKEDSEQLWQGVKNHDFNLFNPVNTKLLNPQGVALRHLPVRLYLPHAANPDAEPKSNDVKDRQDEKEGPRGSVRVVQALVPMSLVSSRKMLLKKSPITWN
ncbi:Autophagy protein 5 [Kalmusia sp. IMI 367209]|nr:Autophagy protein 5 [Kalmusia sp. IMI 367209]